MMKSKIVLVTSLAVATLGLVSLVDTTGVLPFAAQTVHADTIQASLDVKAEVLGDKHLVLKIKATPFLEEPENLIPTLFSADTHKQVWGYKGPEFGEVSKEKGLEKAFNYVIPKQVSHSKYEKLPDGKYYFEFRHQYLRGQKFLGRSNLITVKDGKYVKDEVSSTPKQDEKPTPKPDEKPKPTPTVQSGWVGSSYYQDGKKVTSKWIFDKKYNSYFYLDASGNYVQNAWVGNYYLKSGGYMAKGEWVYDKNYGSYYYLTAEGSYARNTWVGNYYLKSNGKMAKGEWVYDKNYGSYYYLTAEGSYARNAWVGNYYLKSNGKMAKGEWIYDSNYKSYYYLTSEGSYARNAWVGNYYLKSNGKMAKGEWIYDSNYSSYYYLTSEGSYARNTWVGNYYLKSNGKMAKSEWVDGGRYYVGSNGLWETKSSTNSEYSAALGKAKSYNSLFHMSKKRMYRQLTSDFDKFSNDAAQYAVDHLEADYKYNALFNAKNYRKLFNMSKSGLINQLTSSIDGFTEEEAQYAINHLDD